MGLSRRAACALASAAALAMPALASAQAPPGQLIGVVRDANGTPVEGAIVAAGASSTRTDSNGLFRLATTRRDSLTISVRRLGFAPLSARLNRDELSADTLLMLIDQNAVALDRVTIKARDLRSPLGFGTFEERRSRGNGVFITRAEIEKRNTMRLSEVVRGRRGVQLIRLRDGSYGVQFATFSGRSGRAVRCTPELWLDGVRSRGTEIDEIPANTVEAMELYHSFSTTPFQFSPETISNQRCGTIVIWTRIPGGR